MSFCPCAIPRGVAVSGCPYAPVLSASIGTGPIDETMRGSDLPCAKLMNVWRIALFCPVCEAKREALPWMPSSTPAWAADATARSAAVRAVTAARRTAHGRVAVPAPAGS